jgi:D-glycero-D-manno-heptose 1,7-bisphosphate phosphatase
MVAPRQCAILVGGIGSRLGTLTSDTPKPLLDCGGRPFLAWILRELSRFGISEVILLAGYKSELVETFLQQAQRWLPKSLSIRMSVEPFRAGTGGALWHARDLLDEFFLLINGDSWFDTNLARLFGGLTNNSPEIGRVMLRSMNDSSRYGSVELSAGKITAFGEKTGLRNPGLINAGIYLFSRKVLDFIQPDCSLEKDVLPVLASSEMLSGVVLDGYFIDIGVPEDYARAGLELPSRLNRSAVFFDRDGVINEDTGWVGSIDRFQWTDGAKEALQFVNDMGFHAFVVTNQAGVARGLYHESDVVTLHAFVAEELRRFGGTIDDVRFCPDHPDAVISRYRRTSSFRKPAPGMILDLMAKWNVRVERSILIGDKVSDVQAAEAAGISGYLYEGGNLLKFVQSLVLPLCER